MDIKEYLQTDDSRLKRHPWELVRLKMLTYFIRKNNLPKRIADIGSGDAFLASGIASLYPLSTVTAIDIKYNEQLLALISKNKPANLSFSDNISILGKSGQIDVIILMDVLEHIEYPNQILRELLNLPTISKDTHFIITVPAFQKLFSRHDKNLGHYRRYNLKQLHELLQPLSLTIKKSGYCFNSIVLVRLLQVWHEKRKGISSSADEGIHNWKGGKKSTAIFTSLVLD